MTRLQCPTESEEQQALFTWAKLAERKYPEMKLLHAIPNGGLRNKVTAARLKREGVKPGVPDICLPVAREDYNGLYIELKRIKGGVLSEDQKKWISALWKNGYYAGICKGWVSARNLILTYLEGNI
jgi:hypothetical protein